MFFILYLSCFQTFFRKYNYGLDHLTRIHKLWKYTVFKNIVDRKMVPSGYKYKETHNKIEHYSKTHVDKKDN